MRRREGGREMEESERERELDEIDWETEKEGKRKLEEEGLK